MGYTEEFKRFREAEHCWLDDYAMFMALKQAYNGQAWNQWPRPIAFRESSALLAAGRELADEIGRQQFIQYLFFRQFAEFSRRYALRVRE